MNQERSSISSPTLEEVAELFANWRQTKPRRRSIPPALWQSAVSLSSKYSLSEISRSLGLSYTELKKRVSVLPDVQLSKSARKPHPQFIELDIGQSVPVTSCVLEKEDKHGSRMIMRVKVPGGLDLRELVKAFCAQG